ncbi:bacterial transcriptional activator domain-containing protein [Streptomyces sp. NPDC048623]|uniref:bacterial transcriptional activator domain-containing protein n=1 Tax=Streptomyces sp. NPDC048623 TaxID=3155761 RepID=UPI0034409573
MITDDVHVDAHVLATDALDVVHAPAALHDDAVLMALLDRGDLLPDWDDAWVPLEREWLRRLRLRALDTLSVRLARQGMTALALEAALASIRIEPLRENPHRTVVSAHLAEGNLFEALRHFQAYRSLLRTELGVEPSPGLERMVSAPRR